MSVPRGCRRGRARAAPPSLLAAVTAPTVCPQCACARQGARGAPPSLRGGPARHPAMTSLLPVLVLVLVPVLVLVAPLVTVGP